MATAVNVTLAPGAAVWDAGWVENDGTTAAALMVSVAALLVTAPDALVATQV